MDAFQLSNLKVGKRSMVNSITKTLRTLELCVALFFLLWFLTRLPLALRLSADYLRNPLVVFAVFNAIIATLLAQSRRFAQSVSDTSVAEEEQYQIGDTCVNSDSDVAADHLDTRKVYYRSLSEGKGEDGYKTAGRELQRSETEKAREKSYPQDKLSNEEFRRTIEAFIAKQMRLLREESLAISLCN
ncbi:unnamed protein product [Sphenostylis stenocarpa]|uniref:Transmembrane protein n=1 Tax=Sphenostylis stenocarpa TaxID=92480 RepID=A0AA86S132_9FABA|nr:unnamed protein product [Sphenostylis stenocarpa]